MDKWVRYSLLAKICEKISQKGFNLSKMSLHELVYLLSELFSVSVGYDFKLYTYGPYSIELTSDLDYLFSSDFLEIEYIKESSYTGSKIIPGELYSDLLPRGEEFLSENEKKIDKVIDLFGKDTAHELELKAAIIYLLKREKINESLLVDKIRRLKPYFISRDIEIGLINLKNVGILE